TDAILPSEVVYHTLWVESYEVRASNKQLWKHLDLLEERRVEAHLRTLVYKKAITKLYNCKVHPRQIITGDLVLRKVEVSLHGPDLLQQVILHHSVPGPNVFQLTLYVPEKDMGVIELLVHRLLLLSSLLKLPLMPLHLGQEVGNSPFVYGDRF
ncbi:hypothetical protein BHM03_00054606, partial [Ensete ventricosum]